MKMLIKRPVSHLGMIILAAAFLGSFGCAISRPPRDPLAGWTFRQFDDFVPASERHHYQLANAITHDYQKYISDQHLDLNGAITGFYEDGTGRHAVAFEADKYGKDVWDYYLFYDRNDQRMKVLKHYKGRYWNP